MNIKNLVINAGEHRTYPKKNFVIGYGFPRTAVCFAKGADGSVEFNASMFDSTQKYRFIGLLTNGKATLDTGTKRAYGESYPYLLYYHEYGWQSILGQGGYDGGLMQNIVYAKEPSNPQAIWALRGIGLGKGRGEFVPQQVRNAINLSITHRNSEGNSTLDYSFTFNKSSLSGLVGGESVKDIRFRVFCGGIFTNPPSQGIAHRLPMISKPASSDMLRNYSMVESSPELNGLEYFEKDFVYNEEGDYVENFLVGYNRELGETEFDVYDFKIFIALTLN